jgi:hypothetical protein
MGKQLSYWTPQEGELVIAWWDKYCVGKVTRVDKDAGFFPCWVTWNGEATESGAYQASCFDFFEMRKRLMVPLRIRQIEAQINEPV